MQKANPKRQNLPQQIAIPGVPLAKPWGGEPHPRMGPLVLAAQESLKLLNAIRRPRSNAALLPKIGVWMTTM